MGAKRAYLVLGPESSGTRLVTELLIAAGCTGDAGHAQRWDYIVPSKPSRVVWRRSIPHGKVLPDIGEMVQRLRAGGYDVRCVVTWRDWSATARSQVSVGHTSDLRASFAALQGAYAHILAHLNAVDCRWTGVSYESLTSPAARRALAAVLGLPATAALLQADVHNENAKRHYELFEGEKDAQADGLRAVLDGIGALDDACLDDDAAFRRRVRDHLDAHRPTWNPDDPKETR